MLRRYLLVVVGVVSIVAMTQEARSADSPVTGPPESFFAMVRERDREPARAFYKKFIDVDGMPVVASSEVDDEALRRTRAIVTHMLAGRPDVVEALVKSRMYLIIIGKDQVYTDMPEYRNSPDPAYLNERVRGTGGKPTSFGEENLLSLPLDRYDDESIAVHEFCHTIDSTLRTVDPTWTTRLNAAYRNAVDHGRYFQAYAAGNPGEYWAEIAQSYFDCNRVNNWNHGPIGTREQLKSYDPEGYELARTAFQLKPDQDWRYSWLRKLPNVEAPPARLKIDPFYTRFTFAREFPVVGRGASDEALLKANDTIRKMFAYRHDLLKIGINDGVKLVVLGPGEKLSDLPEVRDSKRTDIDLLASYLEDSPETKLIVVAQENVLGDPDSPGVGANQVIRLFARSIYQRTSTRPVDSHWEDRGRSVQQYELRVTRLDVRFGDKVAAAFDEAIKRGKWKGTSASLSPADYWAAGVLAYFDATGQDAAPIDAPHPIGTRELLQGYDSGLFAIVGETMAYEGHVDWRLTRARPPKP